MGDLFGGVFTAYSVIGIVGENDIDDEIFQGFFVFLGFDGKQIFLLCEPAMSPKSDSFDTKTDLGNDTGIKLLFGGEQNDLDSPESPVLRKKYDWRIPKLKNTKALFFSTFISK